MVTALRVDGVDASHHNSVSDLGKAKAAGLKFFYHKVSEGATVSDTTYSSRRELAKKAGLPFGGYHFARPDSKNDAVQEAEWFLKHLKFIPGDLCPMLDLEDTGGLGRAALTRWVRAWMLRVEKEVKCKPIIYTNFDLNADFKLGGDMGAILWMARYNNNNTPPPVAEPWSEWDIFQFSNGDLGVPNRFAGFAGRVDLNHMRKGLHVRDFRSIVGGPEPDKKDRTGFCRIMTQNVKALPLMPQGDVEHDIEMTAADAGVVGWQEIGPDRYKEAVKAMGPNWDHFFAKESRNYDSPISWRKKHWSFVDGGHWLLQQGHAKTSVNRYMTWVLLKHNRTGAEVMFHNGHYVAGAWNDTPKPNKEERKQWWNEANAKHRDWLKEFMAEYPEVAICGLGDYNSTNRRKPAMGDKVAGRKVTYMVSDNSIDQIWFINGTKWKWVFDSEEGERLPGRNSDHQGRRARAALQAA